MEYIFVYSCQPNRDDRTREFRRYIREMEPGLTVWEMICKVENHLKKQLDWWYDPKVINVMPNTVPVPMSEIRKEVRDLVDIFDNLTFDQKDAISRYVIITIQQESEE